MTSDISLAFAHPEERAKASAGSDPRDRISLRDHIVAVEIGAFQTERGAPQRICFNVVVELCPNTTPVDDDVDRILSYDRITDSIADELGAERLNLLETLAERIAERLLTEPRAMRVFVRIEKLDRGPGALGVEIVRSRAPTPMQALTADGTERAVHPLVAHLTNSDIVAPGLPIRLDRLAARGLPVILTVGLPDLPRPRTGHPATQRRIDLLAIEQNAWTLAARDPRCVVVGTRTEIDWAIRQGRMIVWAPSKLVLDAVDGPITAADNALALSLWLAETIAAERLVVGPDAKVPAGSRVPVERCDF